MPSNFEIREHLPSDDAELESLYRDAFPNEDLVPLVRDLSEDESVAPVLVAFIGSRIVGHAIFTPCGITGSDQRVALLGPVAVASDSQRQGIGRGLIQEGLRRLKAANAHRVFVLGDPKYYGQFGFVPESQIAPPYPLPAEWVGAWQSKCLGKSAEHGIGKLVVPRQWQQEALWSS